MSPDRFVYDPRTDSRLRDALFARGVEFPCGGNALCGGCKVRVIEGRVPASPEMREALGDVAIKHGWRLGCLAEAEGPVTLEVEQWSPAILDDRGSLEVEPGYGLGAVVDLGTTTLVAQLVDRTSGSVLAVETGLNPQGRHGADLMSRVRHELSHRGELTALIRAVIGTMLDRLAGQVPIDEVLIVGNTVMHHLFCGLDVEPLAAVPFRSPSLGARQFDAAELGWATAVRQGVHFLPCLGGFVGSDVLAGLVAVGLDEADELSALIDLGTNGEIALGNREGIVYASTAAGPAFEGGRISIGMRAGVGAIDRVNLEDGRLRCSVIGQVAPRGLCGSGLVDAVAALLESGQIAASGRVQSGQCWLDPAHGLMLQQSDIRELQLAKGAIAAGLETLLAGRRLAPRRLFLAGAFGNYVGAVAAQRIGLLPDWAESIVASGNTAVRGARSLLLAPSRRSARIERTLRSSRHVELASDPNFQEAFVAHLSFPAIRNAESPNPCVFP
jgi:uncharacterized 2Fe-2S/4Fe-4S cluster protein (DUF4445 family)